MPDADGYTIRRIVGEDGEKTVWATIDDPMQTQWFDPVPPPDDQPVFYALQLYTLYNGIRFYGGYGEVMEAK